MSDDRSLDRVLHDAGDRWRAAQSAPPEPDISQFVRAHPARWRMWAPVASVAGIAVVVAAVVVPLSLQRGQPEQIGAAPTPTGEASVRALPADQGGGVPVEGAGTLFRDGTGPIMLCSGVVSTLDLPASGAGCGPVAVPTTGVEPRWLVHTTTGGQAYSGPVRVEGTYRDATLAVNRVVEATPDPPPPVTEPPVPCPPPAGGWPPGYGLPAQDDGSALNRLAEHVRASPDRFGDLWEGHPDGPPSADASYAPTRMVYVVGTTGDVDAARTELAALYPGSLCVHKVRYSATDLENVAERLRSNSSTPIEASVLVIENKVAVKVVALDPATVAILDPVGRDALVVEEPLLQWLD